MELEVVYFYIHKKGGTADISPFLLEIIERAFFITKIRRRL